MTEKIAIEEIGEIKEDLEEIRKNPILKPLLDYTKAAFFFSQEDSRESVELEDKIKAVEALINLEIYDDSTIARAYKDVFEIYKRLLWIYSKNVALANAKFGEIRKLVEKEYMSKKVYERETKKLKNQVKDLQKKIPEEAPKGETRKERQQRYAEQLNDGEEDEED